MMIPKYPKVDEDTCIGCALCTSVCPKVFRMNDDGKAEVFDKAGDTEENIQKAIDDCPVSAIRWADEKTKK